MRKLVAICAVATIVLAVSGVANADMVATYSWLQANTQTNWTQGFALQQFDPSLGTLNSVTVTLNAALDQTLGYENKDGAGKTVQFYWSPAAGGNKTGCDYSLSFTGGSLDTYINNAPQYTNIPAYDGTLDYAGTSGYSQEFLLNQSANNVYTDGAMSPFEGTGSMAFDASANGWLYTSYGGGNMSIECITLAGAGVTVAYDYTPIPEPATMCLLGLGAFALRRKK